MGQCMSSTHTGGKKKAPEMTRNPNEKYGGRKQDGKAYEEDEKVKKVK